MVVRCTYRHTDNLSLAAPQICCFLIGGSGARPFLAVNEQRYTSAARTGSLPGRMTFR